MEEILYSDRPELEDSLLLPNSMVLADLPTVIMLPIELLVR